ncbi:MAG: hypothetical protein ABR969_07090 [Sedimentisphaerales bacterium]|jgi:hypothetical protein
MPEESNQENLINDVFAASLPAHLIAGFDVIPKEFKPWHKPRKQWVRYEQWNAEVARLIDDLHISDRPLRYLSLPGDDLLDIRTLSELCEQKSVPLKCLGFNNGLPANENISELNISKSEVFKVHSSSSVLKDDFCSLADNKSVAYQRLEDFGSFDVINLDLCDSLSPLEGPPYHDAIYNLFNLQIKSRSEPWLFFLTTRSDTRLIKREHLTQYWENILHNAEHSSDFREKLEGLIGIAIAGIQTNVALIRKLRSPHFAQIFGLAIGKWLLRMMMSGNPLWPVTMLDSCWYRVDRRRKPNMLSLAFRFDQFTESRTDHSGIVATELHPMPLPDEIGLAKLLIEKICSIKDIDMLLANNPELLEKMILKSTDLLEAARYPVNRYREYLAQHEVRL